MVTRIVFVSDTHRMHNLLDMPKGDILVHCGDFTDWGSMNDILDFSQWLEGLDYKEKICIAGNHDVRFQNYPEISRAALRGQAVYLENSVYESDDGILFYGSPWTTPFGGAFQINRHKEMWDLIPEETDILITHGPPKGILDYVPLSFYNDSNEAGDEVLLERVIKVKPKIHAFGHIHEGYGYIKQRYGITFINAAMMNYKYNCMNKPIVVDWEDGKVSRV